MNFEDERSNYPIVSKFPSKFNLVHKSQSIELSKNSHFQADKVIEALTPEEELKRKLRCSTLKQSGEGLVANSSLMIRSELNSEIKHKDKPSPSVVNNNIISELRINVNINTPNEKPYSCEQLHQLKKKSNEGNEEKKSDFRKFAKTLAKTSLRGNKSKMNDFYQLIEKRFQVEKCQENGKIYVVGFLHFCSSVCAVFIIYAMHSIPINHLKPILCDAQPVWTPLEPYQNAKELKPCSEVCSHLQTFFSLSNGYLDSKLVDLISILLYVSTVTVIVYLILKKFKKKIVFFILWELFARFLSHFAFKYSRVKANYLGELSYLNYLMLFFDGKQCFIIGLLYLVSILGLKAVQAITKYGYVETFKTSEAFVILFPVYEWIWTYLMNLVYNTRLFKYIPLKVRYYYFLFFYCSFKAFKAGLLFAAVRKSLNNHTFYAMILVDFVVFILKKTHFFKRCSKKNKKIINEVQDISELQNNSNLRTTLKTLKQISKKENEKLRESARIETSFMSTYVILFVNATEIAYFYEHTKFNDCYGNANPKFIQSNVNAYHLAYIVAIIHTVKFLASNYILPRCTNSPKPYILPITSIKEGYIKFMLNVFAIVIYAFPQFYEGIFYYTANIK